MSRGLTLVSFNENFRLFSRKEYSARHLSAFLAEYASVSSPHATDDIFTAA
jgi:hypothetical protein